MNLCLACGVHCPVRMRIWVGMVVGLGMAAPAHAAAPTTPGAPARGGFVQQVDLVPSTPAALFGERTIIYLNRAGGAYTGAYGDNSLTNESYVVFAPGTVTIPAWTYGDAKWTQFMGCVRSMYARWDVTITDVDPGQVPHLEHVVGGRPELIGQPSNVGGVATMRADCSPMENGVSFTFSELYNGDVQRLCETAAQETAHSLGLDHSFLCEDPMTYLGGCGAKTFQDVDTRCGEGAARDCMCGNPTQNTVRHLDTVLGVAAAAPPSVAIMSPGDGDTVPPDFTVVVDASDANGIAEVVIRVDGAEITRPMSEPYEASVRGLAPGSHVIEVVATDGAGQTATATATVMVDEDAPPIEPGGGGGGGSADDDAVVSGGCATGGAGHSGGASGALVLLAALGLIARGRRRRG